MLFKPGRKVFVHIRHVVGLARVAHGAAWVSSPAKAFAPVESILSAGTSSAILFFCARDPLFLLCTSIDGFCVLCVSHANAHMWLSSWVRL